VLSVRGEEALPHHAVSPRIGRDACVGHLASMWLSRMPGVHRFKCKLGRLMAHELGELGVSLSRPLVTQDRTEAARRTGAPRSTAASLRRSAPASAAPAPSARTRGRRSKPDRPPAGARTTISAPPPLGPRARAAGQGPHLHVRARGRGELQHVIQHRVEHLRRAPAQPEP